MMPPRRPPEETGAIRRFRMRAGDKKPKTVTAVKNALTLGSLPARITALNEMGFRNTVDARKWLRRNT